MVYSKNQIMGSRFFKLLLLGLFFASVSFGADVVQSGAQKECRVILQGAHQASGPAFDLTAFRLAELRSLNIGLADSVNAIYTFKKDADPAKVVSFLQKKNPSWSASEIEIEVKKRTGALGRARAAISSFGTQKSSFIEQHLVDEFLLENERVFWTSLSNEVKTQLFQSLWKKDANSVDTISSLLYKTENFEEVVSIVSQYLHLFNDAFGNKTSDLSAVPTLILQYLKSNPVKFYQVFEQAFALKDRDPVARSVFEKALHDKLITTEQYLKSADRVGLAQRDRKAWATLLQTSLTEKVLDTEALKIYQKWFQQLLGENFREALDWNRKLTSAAAIKPELSLTNYVSLMGQASSVGARNLILEQICSLSPQAISQYVGDGVGVNLKIDQLLELKPTSTQAQNHLKKFLVDRADRTGDVETVKRVTKKYPDYISKPAIDAAKGLYDRDFLSELVDVPLKAAIEQQDQVNLLLERVLSSVVQSNAPPKAYLKRSRPWTAYLQSVPLAIRAHHVRDLLEKNAGSTGTLAQFISLLDPIPGVPVAVSQFLTNHRYLNSNRSDFSQEQILQMFGGPRFKAFFPHVRNAELAGTIRTRFILAVKLDPRTNTRGINLAWLSEKLDQAEIREGIPAVYGFRVVLQYSRLIRQLNNQFVGAENAAPLEQLKGVIVQGFYEKSGISLMDRLGAERGQDHIEVSAPNLANAIEASLESGLLSNQSRLLQSQFVKNWLISNNATLIEAIRNRAIWIANNQRGFWNLRVELHNFPTSETLRRVKEFKSQVSNATVMQQMDIIIGELERFLQMGRTSAGVRNTISEHLSLSEENKAKLLAMTANFDQISEVEKLETLLAIRNEFDAIKAASSSGKRMTEKVTGQNLLSEAGIAVVNRFIEQLNNATFAERNHVIKLILDHMTLDGYVTAQEVAEWTQSLNAISKDATLNQVTKLNYSNRILNSIVDHIYYKFVDDFGIADNSVYSTVKERNPIKFIDATLRSGFVFMLSKMVDIQYREISQSLNIEHEINGVPVKNFMQVYNKGDAVGILRLNKNPLELTSSEVGVFEEIPAESAPVAAIISVGVGARLSHLQLLAKSLKIPNVQVSRDILPQLKALDGQMVRIRATADGVVKIEKVDQENHMAQKTSRKKIRVPFANHDISTPINFSDLRTPAKGAFAGPKGVTLARLFQSRIFDRRVPDGVILPFGYFNRYVEKTGLKPLLEALSRVKLENKYLLGFITAQIQLKISNTPIPEDMMKEVVSAVTDLNNRTGNKNGNFFRSDTNVEDLPEFNGAGLNDSVPNVAAEEAKMNQAIRTVWISPLTEKSIYWRGLALGRTLVTVAEPSVVIMPTVNAQASGVMISRGGPNWTLGRGLISANHGIGSVVQAERPVEEYTFESGVQYKLSWSAAQNSPKASKFGSGIDYESIAPGSNVLTPLVVMQVNKLGSEVDSFLGPQPFGWDIEWAVDQEKNTIILQARPNM